jgi:hypothetical protein
LVLEFVSGKAAKIKIGFYRLSRDFVYI